MSLRTKWNDQRERDRETVSGYATQIMGDTKWDRLRTRTARRTIVGALAVALTLLAIVSVVASMWVLLPMTLTVVLWIGLRRAVRTIADLPDELIDERQRVVRDRAYRLAFIALSTLLVLGSMAVFGWFLLGAQDGSRDFAIDVNSAPGLTFFVIGVVLSLPSMVIAWTEPEV